MPMTRDQQIRKVAAGVALGVLARDVNAVTGSKPALEFAFNHAWRRWAQADRFPSIKGHDPGNMFWIELGRSERRQGGYAAWSSERWTMPYVKIKSWSLEDALESHARSADDGVSVDEWVQLGRLFIERLEPDEVIYFERG
jgi:hypothetical protein